MTGLTAIVMQATVLAAVSPYATAHRQALETDRPLVVLVGADWCPHCVSMKGNVVPQLKRRGLLRKVAFAMVDSDRQPRLAGQLMQGSSVPQLVMFWKGRRGWRRQRLTGEQSVASVESFVERGITDVAQRKTATSVSHESAAVQR